MKAQSAGILVYRFVDRRLQVLLVHPGGPFWARKDQGAWSIPKGLFEPDETPLQAAQREFQEETGFAADGDFLELGTLRQSSGKTVHAWALEMDLDPNRIVSNTFRLEWPKGSGRLQEYPEVDRGQWFEIPEARRKIVKGQAGFVDALLERLPSRVASDNGQLEP